MIDMLCTLFYFNKSLWCISLEKAVAFGTSYARVVIHRKAAFRCTHKRISIFQVSMSDVSNIICIYHNVSFCYMNTPLYPVQTRKNIPHVLTTNVNFWILSLFMSVTNILPPLSKAIVCGLCSWLDVAPLSLEHPTTHWKPFGVDRMIRWLWLSTINR
jgi:hypothetical protein